MKYGVDVSECQGVIDWAKAKADGVEFAIIRTIKKSGAIDKYLLQNIKGCNSNNIKIDFYKYSYAMNGKDAQDEAKAVVSALTSCGVKPSRDITIWFDLEEDAQLALGKQTVNEIYDCFKEVCWNSGFSYGLYMGEYRYKKYAYFNELSDNVWIAKYPDTNARKIKDVPPESKGPVAIGNNVLWGWQFSSKGKVSGIDGYVDLNVCYANTKETQKTEPVVEYYKTPQFTLVDALSRINVDVSKSNRSKIAAKNGITNYTGTAEQNIKMYNLLMSGKLIK